MLQKIKDALGDSKTILAKKALPIVAKINSYEEAMRALSDDELRAKTIEFRERHAQGESLEKILPEAYAVVRETSVRETGLRHYDVQMVGGILLFQGKIAEMKTGEGKTLVATLPTYLLSIAGRGVHVVTVNDYLSRRDAVWVGQIYARLGLSIGVINSDNTSYAYDASVQTANESLDDERDEVASFKVVYDFLRPCTRTEAYACDVTYGTNNEFGFDYLRDNIEFNPKQLRQRDLAYAIVDEIDSVLIDEARTPLIISMPGQESENLYAMFAGVAQNLNLDEHYTIDEKFKQIALTDAGIEAAEKALGVENIYTERGIKYVHHLEIAVKAKALFHKEKEYVVKDGAIVIVDEFTGRMQPGRRWSEGLHQAIEAKEGLAIQEESKTIASVTYQNYFRMYEHLCGMTGTAVTSSEEFFKVYGLDVVVVPTNVPVARIDLDDLIFQTEKGKYMAIASKVSELHAQGQPVLIGTVSVEKSEALSRFLEQEKIPHEILNAKNHEREGEIVADAGRRGAVTVATNMAGRGVDIKLGGINATDEKHNEIVKLGGLYVIGTERHDARRIDNQLRGRSGRQGDPGETAFYVSMEDTMMRVFANDVVKKMMGRMGMREDEPITHKLISRSLESAQTRIEGMNFDSRKHVLQYDDVLNTQRKTIYANRRIMLVGDNSEVEPMIDQLAQVYPSFAESRVDKTAKLGADKYIEMFKKVYLEAINTFWMEHLDTMDMVRSSVTLRAYGQRDPLVEYKKEGLIFFRQLLLDIDEHVADIMRRLNTDAVLELEERARQKQAEVAKIIETSGKKDESVKKNKTVEKKEEQKIGRNDPCPCGSGKKYKACHGK